MGYQPRAKSFRGSDRGFRKLRGEKGRAERRKRNNNSAFEQVENQVASVGEVSERTLRRLRNLGSQRFGCSPFSDYFDRWLSSLSDVLSEFESSPAIGVDGQFVSESLRVLSVVEFQLEERRWVEASFEEGARSLPGNKSLLKQFKEEYLVRAKEIKARKNREIKSLYARIDNLRGELDKIVRIKTGFLRGISKKDREQKEAATIQELNNAQRELELAMLELASEQKSLREKYEWKWQPVIAQIRDCQKKIESLETDGSREDRWFACEALVDSVNALLQRKMLQLHQQR
jgi:hypothetical protein